MKKVLALVLALAMVVSLAACGGGSSNNGSSTKALELTLGHTNNTEHHYHTLSEAFKKAVEAYSNGAIKVNVFPAEQLGSGQAMLENVKSGTQDIVLDPDAYLANYNDLFNVCSLAYLYSDWTQTDAFLQSEARTILEKAAEDSGFIILGWTANGFRYFTMKNEIKSAADFQGKKLRCGSNQLVIDLFSALGMAPTSLSMSDTYNGISTGTVDGQENSLANIVGFGVGLVCTIVGTVWSLLVIAIAWIAYRPVLGITILVVAGGILGFFVYRGRQKKLQQPQPAQQPGQAPNYQGLYDQYKNNNQNLNGQNPGQPGQR